MTSDGNALSALAHAAATAAGSRLCLASDIDGTLVLEESATQPGLVDLTSFLSQNRENFLFTVATGRSLKQTKEIFEAYCLPLPDVIIASVGTEIFHGRDELADTEWSDRLDHGWDSRQLQSLDDQVPGLRYQEQDRQRPHKVSFYVDPEQFREKDLSEALDAAGLAVSVVYSRKRFLDLLPKDASKGKALLHVCKKYGVDIRHAIACGDSGNDRDLLLTAGHGVVVANHADELRELVSNPSLFFSAACGSAGVLDGLRHHFSLICKSFPINKCKEA